MYVFYYLTNDGGKTWNSFLYDGGVAFLDGRTGWRFSQSKGGGYELQKTESGSQDWSLVSTLPWRGRMAFGDEQHGWAFRVESDYSETLCLTEDGGAHWEELAPIMVNGT
jgi:photosystem II stability/assembly factor-like uncharacterized protein